MEFKRSLYKKGHSYETTLPKFLLLGLDSKKKYDTVFEFKDNKWYFSLDSAKKEKNFNKIRRKLYQRASSFEITIPKILLLNLDLSKKHSVIFKQKNKRWLIEIK